MKYVLLYAGPEDVDKARHHVAAHRAKWELREGLEAIVPEGAP